MQLRSSQHIKCSDCGTELEATLAGWRLVLTFLALSFVGSIVMPIGFLGSLVGSIGGFLLAVGGLVVGGALLAWLASSARLQPRLSPGTPRVSTPKHPDQPS